MPASDIWQHASASAAASHGVEPMHSVSTTHVYEHSNGRAITDSDVYRVGIYGWRKRCLYVFILLLTVVIVVNLALTVWIMSVLDFTPSGMGALQIEDEGIRVTGKAEFENPVHFQQLSTKDGVPLSIESDHGLYLHARNSSGMITSRLSLEPDGTVAAAYDGGTVFEGAIQTSIIRPEPDSVLQLESPTRSLRVDAAQDIEMMARAGDVKVMARTDIEFTSKNGRITFDTSNVYFPKLSPMGSANGDVQYQVCVCKGGRVFFSESECRAQPSICPDPV